MLGVKKRLGRFKSEPLPEFTEGKRPLKGSYMIKYQCKSVVTFVKILFKLIAFDKCRTLKLGPNFLQRKLAHITDRC